MSDHSSNWSTPILTPLGQNDTAMSTSAHHPTAPAVIHSPAPTQLPGPSATTSDIVQLIDDMRNNDLSIRLNAFKHLSDMSRALGSARTRNELIPYLCEFIDDDDEILIVICDWLERADSLIELLGGSEQLSSIFPLLFQLVSTDELNVRTHAINVTKSILDKLSPQQTVQFIESQLTQLCTNDWFTSRMSSTYLFSQLYKNIKSIESLCVTMRSMYIKLCNDETPMVRRKAVENLSELIDNIQDYVVIKDEILPVLNKLCKDEQDSVRLLCIQPLIHILKYITKNEKITKIIPKFIDFSNDKSWRVRYIFGEKFIEFLRELGEPYSDDIIDCYISLLTDDENEVRQISVKNLGTVCNLIGYTQSQKKLFHLLKKLVRDTCIYTRINLSHTLINITNIIPKQQYTQVFTELILPNFLLLLKDDNYEVKLNTIKQISLNNEILSNNMLKSSILPCIVEISKCDKWRIRKNLIDILYYLAKNLDSHYFNDKILPISLSFLGDPIFAIRLSAVYSIIQLCTLFDSQWIETYIIDKINLLSTNKSYLNRIISLYLIYHLIDISTHQLIQQHIIDILYTFLNDKVKNIKFFSIRILGLLCIKYNDSAMLNDIRNKIQQCVQNETDTDVLYFSKLATKIIDQLLNQQPNDDHDKQHLMINNAQLIQQSGEIDSIELC